MLGACGSDRADELANYAPKLPGRWVKALAAHDDSSFQDFACQEGAGYLLLVESNLGFAFDTSSLEAFKTSFLAVEPPLTRVYDVLASEYGFHIARERYQRFLELPSEEALSCVRSIKRAYAIETDKGLAPSEKIEGTRFVFDHMNLDATPISITHLLLRISTLERRRGNREGQRKTLEECIDMDRRLGNHRMTCQALGVLGAVFADYGDIEGMFQCWNQGLDLAKEHRLPEQTGRLMSFFANYYDAVGRLVLARELRRGADELCRKFGGAPGEVRFLENWLQLNARLGCWDVVNRDLQRADLQLARYREWGGGDGARERSARIKSIRARAEMVVGRVEEANALFASSETELADLKAQRPLSDLRLNWGWGLLENARVSEAQDVFVRGLSDVCDPRIHVRLLIASARAHSILGEWEACDEKLETAQDSQDPKYGEPLGEWTLFDVLKIKSAFQREDMASTIEAVQMACRNLERRLRSQDAAQESYLALRNVQVLRDELHRLVKGNQELRYILELQWRDVPRLLGNKESAASAGEKRMPSPLDICSRLVTGALENSLLSNAGEGGRDLQDDRGYEFRSGVVLADKNSIHVVYRVRADSLERWCLSEDGLIYESLPITRFELRERVNRILSQVQSVPAQVSRMDGRSVQVSEDLQGELHELAMVILPEEVFQGTEECRSTQLGGSNEASPLRILLSSDGVLDALPFGILNLSRIGYRPLILRYDPVYIGLATLDRKGGNAGVDRDATDVAQGLIIADPVAVPGSFGWWRKLPRLENGIREAEALQEWKPDSILLERELATKEALLAGWKHAPFLYFASHVVRDPEVPYLSCLPLSLSATEHGKASRREDSYLDALDLRPGCLKGRPLVVLSACSSGAPYLVRGAQAPGLGDSFLRAGASTVIQTLWSVRDDAAAELMQKAFHSWAVDEMAPDRALNAARRWLAIEGSFTHPYFWGAAIVKTNGFPTR